MVASDLELGDRVPGRRSSDSSLLTMVASDPELGDDEGATFLATGRN